MAKTVRDIMTREVVTLSVHEDLGDANHVMKLKRVRHLPVTQGVNLVGMVSHRDLLRAQVRALSQVRDSEPGKQYVPVSVSDFMTRDVQVVSPDAPLGEAARALLKNKFGCLPVVENGNLVGIVTETDFLKWAVAESKI